MDLFIETLTGTAFELRVSPNDTVMSIKSKIQRVEGIPIGQQHLIWKNDELSDHQSLLDCSIPGGATLRLVLGMRGGPINTYRPPPMATTASIRFTPTVHFKSSSPTVVNLKKNRRDDAGKNPSLATSTASLRDFNDSIDSETMGKKEQEGKKHITFFIFNSGEDLLRVLDCSPRSENPLLGGPASSSVNGTSTTSLLGPDDSSCDAIPYRGTPNSQKNNLTSNLLSASTAAQSLPYLQTEPSGALSCEELPQLASTTSEPSVLQAAAESESQSSPTSLKNVAAAAATAAGPSSTPASSTTAATALLAGLLYAARGGDTAYSDDTDDCVSSDCGGSGPTTAYWLRPPSPELDYRDNSSSSVTENPNYHAAAAPPALEDFPFLFGDEEGEDGDAAGDDDDDSLADLEDYFLYYRSGDVLFGPPTSTRRSVTSLWDKDSLNVYSKGSATSPRKALERDNLAEKVRAIKVQLCQAREDRLHRRQQRQKQGMRVADDTVEGKSQETDLPDGEVASSTAASPSPTASTSSHLPKIRTPWHPGNHHAAAAAALSSYKRLPHHRFVTPQHPITPCPPYRSTPHFHRPYTTSSVVDLPTSGVPIDVMPLLPPPSRRPLAGLQRPRGTAPSKTTSETDLDAASVIPGFSPRDGIDGGGGIGYFHRPLFGSSGSIRQRRLGTVVAPNISQIGHLKLSNIPSVPTGNADSALFSPSPKAATLGSDRPSTFMSSDRPPCRSARFIGGFGSLCGGASGNADVEPTRGRSPTVKKGVNGSDVVVPLPPILPRGGANLKSIGGVGVGNLALRRQSTWSKVEDIVTSAISESTSSSKPRPDMSEPPRRSPKPKNNRCASCNRKTGLANSYTCRCDRIFCSRHRYAEMHACPFDYKADARRLIRESNPVITAAKLPKI